MVAVEKARRIRGDGATDESAWRDWLAMLRPRAVAPDELLSSKQRLVVVSPHPDDEVLACGGLLALHAWRAGEAAIVAVTDGEASHRGDPSWRANRLAATRRSEREAGLARLGVGAHAVTPLALPDGQVGTRREALIGVLHALLRPSDCVVSTWRLDGHPDHDATGTSTAQACATIGCRLIEAPVWMWHWSQPADARVPWHRLRALPLPPAALRCKAAALAEHATQLAARHREAPVLGPAILARAAWDTEYFLV